MFSGLRDKRPFTGVLRKILQIGGPTVGGATPRPVCVVDISWVMLIVTGSVRARPDSIERVLALSLEHVHRSRREPGCLLHSVHRDAEDSLRLVFVEHWADADALRTHFEVPASGVFVQEVTALANGSPEMAIYDAHPVSV